MSSEAAGVSGLAGRYATALFELADADGALDQVAQDLGALGGMIAESDEFRRMLRSPVLSRDAQSRALDAIAEKAGFSSLTRRFVGLVAANRRLFALERMIGAYRTLLARHRGEISAEVTSATPLKDSQVDALRTALKSAVGSDVDLTTEVDPSLIGGLVVRVGSRMVDSSLRSKLQRLQLVMKGAG